MKKRVLLITVPYEGLNHGHIRLYMFEKYLGTVSDLTVINPARTVYFFQKRCILSKLANRAVRKNDRFRSMLYRILLRKEFRRSSFDYVYICSSGAVLANLPVFIKQIDCNVRVVMDLLDPIAGRMGDEKRGSHWIKQLEHIERKAIVNTDDLIVLSAEIKDYYVARYSVPTHLIPQGFDPISIPNVPTIRDTGSFVVLTYAGVFYLGGREPFELYKAIMSYDDRVKLSIFGGLKKMFTPPKDTRFHYGGRVQRSELYSIYEESDVIVFIDNKDTLQVPGKTMEVLALNKPILFIYYIEDSPSYHLMKGYDGIFYTRNEACSIKSAIDEVLELNCYYYKRDLSKYTWDTLAKEMGRAIGIL